MDAVIGIVNFICATGLDHRQFNKLLNEIHTPDVPHRTYMQQLSHVFVFKRFYDLRALDWLSSASGSKVKKTNVSKKRLGFYKISLTSYIFI